MLHRYLESEDKINMKKYQKTVLIEVVGTSNDGDFLVQNEDQDNDQWIIPKNIFESTYEEVKQDFSWALRQLKAGCRVARKGWNGKDMFIYLVNGSEVPAGKLRNEAKGHVTRTAQDTTPVTINAHIDMKAADDSIVIGWFASQTDMLAEDWMVV